MPSKLGLNFHDLHYFLIVQISSVLVHHIAKWPVRMNTWSSQDQKETKGSIRSTLTKVQRQIPNPSVEPRLQLTAVTQCGTTSLLAFGQRLTTKDINTRYPTERKNNVLLCMKRHYIMGTTRELIRVAQRQKIYLSKMAEARSNPEVTELFSCSPTDWLLGLKEKKPTVSVAWNVHQLQIH